MGLLQKAREQKFYSPASREEKFPLLIKKLRQNNNKLEFYHILFKGMVDLFSIEKGALLIKEGDRFNLSSINGYDETTKNRLRIKVEDLENYNRSGNINPLKKYFSIRESINLDTLLISMFRNNNEITGLLLITDFKTITPPQMGEIDYYCKKVEGLWNNNPLNKLQEGVTYSSEIRESVTGYCQRVKNSENRIIFIKFSIEKLINNLIKSDPHITATNIKSNILRILKTFINKRGEVFNIKSNEILILLVDKSENINIQVMQQQILAAFKTIFSKKLGNINLNYETLIWRDNSLENIIDHLID